MYYIYMLRCENDSIYTGITTNLERRMEEHFGKTAKCAKYTMRHTAKKLEAAWETQNRIFASKLEYAIKTLKKAEKEELIKTDKILKLLEENIEIKNYKRCKIN